MTCLSIPLVALCVFALLLCPVSSLSCKKGTVVFVFGDSNSDTGGNEAFEGALDGYPRGRIFPGIPSGRFTDGRLIVDFFCEYLSIKYLTSYMYSFDPNFNHGANFAIAGAIIGSGAPYNGSSSFYTLGLQTNQFKRFHNLSVELGSRGLRNSIAEEGFKNALYVLDIGQNDLTSASANHNPHSKVIQEIPTMISEVRRSITAIYRIGGRKFWVHNTGPLGCFPFEQVQKTNDTELDAYGCIKYLNDAAQVFNQQLNQLVQQLRAEMVGSIFVVVDMYSVKYDLIGNAASYGFMDPFVPCHGQTGWCTDASKYISFDGVHFTDAANAIVSNKILSTRYSDPPLPLDFFCASN